jgi:hypothetical protein
VADACLVAVAFAVGMRNVRSGPLPTVQKGKLGDDDRWLRFGVGWDEFAQLGVLLGIIEVSGTQTGPDGLGVPSYTVLVAPPQG